MVRIRSFHRNRLDLSLQKSVASVSIQIWARISPSAPGSKRILPRSSSFYKCTEKRIKHHRWFSLQVRRTSLLIRVGGFQISPSRCRVAAISVYLVKTNEILS